MKLNRVTFLVLLMLFSGLLLKGQSKLNLMSNYYSIQSSYLETNQEGMDFFSVSSSGSTISEFRSNAKVFILKRLIYEGFMRKDVMVEPIANKLDLQQKFKANEADFLKRLLNKNGLIKEVAFDKGKKNIDEQLYQPVIKLMVDRDQIEMEFRNLLN